MAVSILIDGARLFGGRELEGFADRVGQFSGVGQLIGRQVQARDFVLFEEKVADKPRLLGTEQRIHWGRGAAFGCGIADPFGDCVIQLFSGHFFAGCYVSTVNVEGLDARSPAGPLDDEEVEFFYGSDQAIGL